MRVGFSVFQPAIEAMCTGNVGVLKRLLAEDHGLAAFRLDEPTDGCFANPYLLWFIAGNPARNGSFREFALALAVDVFSGDTPLHLATTSGNVEAVKLLLAAGADITIKSRRIRETPPSYAQHYLNEDKFGDEHLERIREINQLFKQHF